MTARGLVARWVPVDGAGGGALKPPFVELAADGTYTGSDGANGTHGRWSSGPGAELQVEPGLSTRMACDDMVPVPTWFTSAARARVEGRVLVLLDAAGSELGRVEQAS